LLVPAFADATCGDHVQILPPGASSSQPGDAEHPAPTAPCHGPNCSRGSLPLQAPPLAPPTVVSGPTELMLDVIAPPEPSPSSLLASDNPSLPNRSADPIFHPPRG
jgi:hypothetical protein